MKTNFKSADRMNSIYRMAVGTLALAVCLGLPSFVAAQDQPAQDQQSQSGDASAAPPSAETQPPADAAPAQPSEVPVPEAAPQSQAPSSGWHYNPGPQDSAPQGAPDSSAAPAPPANAPAPQAGPQGARPPAPPAATAPQGPVPQTLTLPAGTVISVRTRQWISSDQNHAGDTFSAELDQPLVVNGWVVARRGQSVIGRVVLAQRANHGNNESRLGVELAEITLVDGQQVPVSTELVQNSKTRSANRDAATVGATTAIGAIIGAAAGGGTGAAIGAAAGIGAGMATIMATPGRPTIIRPEDLLTFRLQSPVDISTERSQVAFRPVTQADYGREQDANRPRLRYPGPGAPYAPYAAYPPPPYYYGPYCGGPWGCYPGPVFFGGIGFGPPVFVGRGYWR